MVSYIVVIECYYYVSYHATVMIFLIPYYIVAGLGTHHGFLGD